MTEPSPKRSRRAQQQAAEQRDEDTRRAAAGELPSEAAIWPHDARLNLLRRMSMAVLSADSPESIVRIATDSLNELFDCLHAGISLYDPTDETMIVLSSIGHGWPSGMRMPVRLREAFSTITQGELIYLPNIRAVSDNSPSMQHAVALGGRSLLAAPVQTASIFLGVLWVITDQPYTFTEEEKTIARAVADLVAVSLYNRRLLMAEQEARERERALREVGASLILDLELDQLLRHILDHLRRLIPFSSASVVLRDGQELVFAALDGVEVGSEQIDWVRQHLPAVMQTVFDTGTPLMLDDTTTDPRWEPLPGFAYIRSWLGVPLSFKGACIGALTIDRDRPRGFTAADVELALAFANQVAVAIENARLYAVAQTHAEQLEARVRERTRELEALFGITAATIADPELATVLARALELAAEAFGCPAAAVHLIPPDERELHLMAHLDRDGGDFAALLAEPAVAALLGPATTRMMTWDEAQLATELGRGWPRAVAAAPLRAHRQNVGVLSLWSATPNAFTDSARLLTAMADQLGAGVENLRLRQMTREAAIIEERERLARDLHDAVTQTIFSAGLFAEAARESARAGDLSLVERHSQTVVERVHQALGEMRLLLFELRTDTLAEQGLAGALSDRLRAVEERASIATQLRVDALPELPLALEETFYRVALEALNNALHHSHAQRVGVSLRVVDGWLVLTIRDNGIGFHRRRAARHGGMGLSTMTTRIHKVGGTIRIHSRPGQGTRVEARAPLPPAPEESRGESDE